MFKISRPALAKRQPAFNKCKLQRPRNLKGDSPTFSVYSISQYRFHYDSKAMLSACHPALNATASHETGNRYIQCTSIQSRIPSSCNQTQPEARPSLLHLETSDISRHRSLSLPTTEAGLLSSREVASAYCSTAGAQTSTAGTQTSAAAVQTSAVCRGSGVRG